MTKKAAFFDIDGTLLDRGKYIPKSAIEGIRKLREAGNYAFLCTGRSRAHVTNKELLAIGFDGIISGCGTMIEFRDEVIFYKKIETGMLKETVTFLKENGAAIIMEGRFHLFLDQDDFGDNPYAALVRRELGETLLPITGGEADWEVSKFSCDVARADTEILKQRLSVDYELFIHDIPVIEIVPKGHSKGTGILKLCEHLGIAAADTYAFGDSANDLPMFEAAGHSIAMGNSSEIVKQKASYVTDTLLNDGIYHALEHFKLF